MAVCVLLLLFFICSGGFHFSLSLFGALAQSGGERERKSENDIYLMPIKKVISVWVLDRIEKGAVRGKALDGNVCEAHAEEYIYNIYM